MRLRPSTRRAMLLRFKREAMRRAIDNQRNCNMTPQQLAEILTGREYTREITKEEAVAKASGLVVVFGASDDLMEFRGAIHDELGAYDGTTARVTPEGLLPAWDSVDHSDEDEAERYFKRKALGGQDIHAIWGPPDLDGTSWAYGTEIPHATFEVMDGGDLYCRGIVFAMADVKA